MHKSFERIYNIRYSIKDRALFDKAEHLYQESFKLYEKAIKQGSSESEKALLWAKYDLASNYSYSNQCFKSKALMSELLAQNVDIELKGNTLWLLGRLSDFGVCAREDERKAIELYGQSCDLGYSMGCADYNISNFRYKQ